MGCSSSVTASAPGETPAPGHSRWKPRRRLAQGLLEKSKPKLRKSYVVGEKIGEGSFGEVRSGEHRLTKQPVAVKILDVERRTAKSHKARVDGGQRKAGGNASAATTGKVEGEKSQTLPEGCQTDGGQAIHRRGHRGGLIAPDGSATLSSALRSGSMTSALTSIISPRGAVGTMSRGVASISTTNLPSVDASAKFQKSVQSEVAVLKALGHNRHCIQFHDFFDEQGICYIVTELCKGGNMLELMEAAPSLTVPDLQRVMKEMALALVHVHDVGLVHRDIKPENFLLGGEDNRTIKLADFGAATQLPQDGSTLHSVYGTAPYMSPEMIGDEGYDQRTDLWSLGATYYVLLYAEFPYGSREKTPGKMKAAIFFGVPEPAFKQREGKQALVHPVPEGAEELVHKCLRRQVWQRPSAMHVLRNQFLRDVKVHDRSVELGVDKVKHISTEASAAESDVSTTIPEGHLRSVRSSMSELDCSSRQTSKRRSM